MNQRSAKNMDGVRLLFVDDDDISIMAIERGIEQLSITNPVAIAKDGVEALATLNDALGDDGALPPYIVILDLNMPKMGGLEFLEKIRKHQALKKVVVFVLTTSDAPSDITAAYNYNIAGYIVKEDTANRFEKTLALVTSYAQLVVLPS